MVFLKGCSNVPQNILISRLSVERVGFQGGWRLSEGQLLLGNTGLDVHASNPRVHVHKHTHTHTAASLCSPTVLYPYEYMCKSSL